MGIGRASLTESEGRMMGESEEFVAEEVARLKRLHGYEGSENDKCNLRPK